MAQKNSPALLIEVVGIMFSEPLIEVFQHAPWFPNEVANLIEILLEWFEADDVVNNEAIILVIEDRVLRSRQMTEVMARERQFSKYVRQGAVASSSTIFPPGDETIPWIPDDGEPEIPGGSWRIFRT